MGGVCKCGSFSLSLNGEVLPSRETGTVVFFFRNKIHNTLIGYPTYTSGQEVLRYQCIIFNYVLSKSNAPKKTALVQTNLLSRFLSQTSSSEPLLLRSVVQQFKFTFLSQLFDHQVRKIIGGAQYYQMN